MPSRYDSNVEWRITAPLMAPYDHIWLHGVVDAASRINGMITGSASTLDEFLQVNLLRHICTIALHQNGKYNTEDDHPYMLKFERICAYRRSLITYHARFTNKAVFSEVCLQYRKDWGGYLEAPERSLCKTNKVYHVVIVRS